METTTHTPTPPVETKLEECPLCGNPEYDPKAKWDPSLCPCCTCGECQGPIDDNGNRET